MDHVEFAYTHGMDGDEVDERLHESGTGVLCLARDNDAYAIPVAHHYDGDQLYFRLGITDGSTKQAFLATTDTACYVLFGTEPTDDPREIDSWSIMITGPLTPIEDPAIKGFETADINRYFSPIRVFDEGIDEIEIMIVALDIETITGRTTPQN